MKSNWWYNASIEDRLKQVKEAAQLEMTEQQIAKNLKVDPIAIRLFAKQNSIKIKLPFKLSSELDIPEDIDQGDPGAALKEDDLVLEIEPDYFMIDILSNFGNIARQSIEEWD